MLKLISNPVRVIPTEYNLDKTDKINNKLVIYLDPILGDVENNFNVNDLLHLDTEFFKGFAKVVSTDFTTQTIIYTDSEYYNIESLGGLLVNTTTGTEKANVIAGITQIPYELKREDYQLESIYDDGTGLMAVKIDPAEGDVNLTNEVGNTIYIENNNFTGFTVIQAIIFDGTNTIINTDLPYTGLESSGGILNNNSFFLDYLALISIIDSETNKTLIDTDFEYTPNDTGKLFIDVKSLIHPLIEVPNYTKKFKLRYKEFYGDAVRSSTDDENVFVLAAKKNILSVGGSAMWEHLLRPRLGKNLTEFSEEIKTIGWAKYFYFLFDEYFSSRVGSSDLYIRQSTYDVNKSLIAEGDSEQITPQIGINKIAVLDAAGAYYIKPEILSSIDSSLLNEPIFYKLVAPCEKPIMLEWLNRNGVFDSWLFSVNQDLITIPNDGVSLRKPIVTSIDTQKGSRGYLTTEENTDVILTAENLTDNRIKVLTELKISPIIYMWLNNTGADKIKVTVSGEFQTELKTSNYVHSIIIAIKLPPNFRL